jgi:hypothetical protein
LATVGLLFAITHPGCPGGVNPDRPQVRAHPVAQWTRDTNGRSSSRYDEGVVAGQNGEVDVFHDIPPAEVPAHRHTDLTWSVGE